jgi:hypothetical protein
MDLRRVVVALVALWDELPELVGPAWTELFADMAAMAAKLAEATDDGQRASVVSQLALLFREHPAVATYLAAAFAEEQRSTTPGAGERALSPAWPEVIADLRERVAPPTVIRHTDVHAPRRLPLGRRGVLVVRLTSTPPPGSQPVRPVALRLGQLVEVYLHTRPEDVAVEGGPVRRLRVESDRDSDPVVFYLTPTSVGSKTLRLDLRQAGLVVTTLPLTIEVTGQSAIQDSQLLEPMAVSLGGAYVPPPDLDVRVTVEARDAQTLLRYVLHSPNGAAGHHYQPAGEVTITGAPAQYQAHLMRRIEGLKPAEVEGALRTIGERLYREVFPPELRRAYRRFRTLVSAMQITSDEPWIPWELVRPYDDENPDAIIDDDFLAAQFDLTRWLAGPTGPASRIDVTRLACIEAGNAPGQPTLPATKAERTYLASLARSRQVEDHSPIPATGPAVEALLDNGVVELWHVAAHGNVDLIHPEESVVVLADGSKLRPDDLSGPRQTAIASHRPLVFLNACRVGQQAWSLTQLGGWAAAWIRRCRCGAFLGPLWSVTDQPAAQFAQAFYDKGQAGHTIGQAARAARTQIRAAAPSDPTWLAYSVYAHPNARVTFGDANGTSTPSL